MIAKEIEGTLYHFLSDFFAAAAAAAAALRS